MNGTQIALVGMGGLAGSVLRYMVAQLVLNQFGLGAYAWSTLAVNAFGCLVIGGLYAQTGGLTSHSWLLLAVGFCGGLTTFSTLVLDVHRLMYEAGWPVALGYALGSFCGGLAAFYAGLSLLKH